MNYDYDTAVFYLYVGKCGKFYRVPGIPDTILFLAFRQHLPIFCSLAL